MTISFSGLASGLDTSSWIESLVALKQAKITTLETEKTTISTQRDSLNVIKSFFTAFRNQVDNITTTSSTNIFTQKLATSSNTKFLTATASIDAAEGTYNIGVKQLATNTTARSNYYSIYSSTTTVNATETESTLEEDLGLTFTLDSAVVGIKVGDITKDIVLYKTDTLKDLIEKLQEIGVSADYNEKTGVFSVNLSTDDIIDRNGTGIVDKLHLTGVNEGYQNDTVLNIYETIYSSATSGTNLSTLASAAGKTITAGNIQLTTNGANYNVSINGSTTIAGLVNALNNKAGHTIAEYDEVTGIFTVTDAVISDNGTGLTNVLGLDIDIYSKTQQTNNLTHIISQVATLNTKIVDLGDGITISGNKTFTVLDSNSEAHAITVNSNTTVGSLVQEFTNAGLYSKFNADGTLEITGGTIQDGTDLAIKSVLGLSDDPYTAMVTGNQLKEVIEYNTPVTLQTKFVDDLLVGKGYLKITNEDGDTFYEKIYEGQTIADFMADLGNLGIYSTLDEDTGVLEITGGEFETLTDAQVQALIDNSTIHETDAAYKKGTNLLTCLFGSAVISPMMTSVSRTRASSAPLYQNVTDTYDATLSTTMGAMEVTAGTAVFNVRGDNRTVNITTSMTIQGLMDELEAQGIASSWDEDNSRLTINNATLESTGTSNINDIFGMTTTIAGKYKTSNTIYHNVTTAINATLDTTFETLGVTIDSNTTVIHDSQNNAVGTITLTKTSKISDLINYINDNTATTGVSASLQDGVLRINDGYIENAEVERALGMEMTARSSYVLGSVKTYNTVTTISTSSTKLENIIQSLGTTSEVSGGYNLSFNGTALVVGTNTTIDEIISQVYAKGGTAYLDSSGRLAVNGGTLTGSVANALGVMTVTKTESVIATGEDLNTRITDYAQRNTTFADLGITENKNIVVYNSSAVATTTLAYATTDTIGKMLDDLKTCNINGVISDGVIELTSINGNYVTGTLADSLGIGTATTTTVVNRTATSTSSVVHTTVIDATEATKVVDIITSADKTIPTNRDIVVNDYDNSVLGTISITDTTTLGDLFEQLSTYDIDGDIHSGVIYMSSTEGHYVSETSNGILNALGISLTSVVTTTTVGTTQSSSAAVQYTITTTTGTAQTATVANEYTVTTTTGSTQTSSVEIQHEVETYADEQTALSNYVATGTTVVVTHADGNTNTITTTEGETFATLFNKLSSVGITGTISDGVVMLSSNVDGTYVSSGLEGIGIDTISVGDTYTVGTANNSTATVTYASTTGSAQTSSAAIQYTTTTGSAQTSSAAIKTTEHAGLSTKIKDCNTALVNTTVAVKNSYTGGTVGSYTITNDSTFDNLFDALDNFGIQGIISDGVVTFTSNYAGYYVDGLSGMGISTVSVGTTTTGKEKTSTANVTYTQGATYTDKISDCVEMSTVASDNTVIVKGSSGNNIGSITVTNTMTFDEFFGELSKYGIQGTINDGRITLTSNDNRYIETSGGNHITSKLGIGTGDTTVTLGWTYTTTSQVYTVSIPAGTVQTGSTITGTTNATYTETHYAEITDKVSDYVSNFNSTDKTITVTDNGGMAVGSFAISAATTFGEMFNSLSTLGVQGTIEDGYIMLTSNNGSYATGDVLTSLGISTTSRTVTIGSDTTTITSENTIITPSANTSTTTISTTVTIGSAVTGTSGATYTRPVQLNDIVGSVVTLSTDTNKKIRICSSTHNGIGTITIDNTSTTFAQMFDTLDSYGIQCVLDENGVISFNSNCGNYIDANWSGSLPTLLGVSNTAQWNVKSMYTQSGVSSSSQITATGTTVGVCLTGDTIQCYKGASRNTTLGELRYYDGSEHSLSGYTLKVCCDRSGTSPLVKNYTFSASSTVSDVLQTIYTAAAGYGYNMRFGVYYSYGIFGCIIDSLGSTQGQGIYIDGSIASMFQNDYASSVGTGFGTYTLAQYSNVDSNTSLSNISWGYTSGTIYYHDATNNTTRSITVSSSDNYNTLKGNLASIGNCSINDGAITLNEGNNYILYNSCDNGGKALLQRLGLGSSAGDFYDALPGAVATTNTTFAELGITNQQSMTIFSSGTKQVLYMGTNTTIGDFQTFLASAGITSILGNDGILSIGATEQAGCYIHSISHDLANALHIPESSTDLVTTRYTSTFVERTSNSNVLTESATLNGNATMKQAYSSFSTSYITVNCCGTDCTITVEANDTVNDLFSTLAGYGIAGSITGGTVTLTPTQGTYIKGISDNIKTALKLSGTGINNYTTSTVEMGTVITSSYSFTTTTVTATTTHTISVTDTITSNTSSGQKSKTNTVTATGNTTLEQLGITANQSMTIVTDPSSAGHTVTFNKNDTINDMLTTLAGYGVSGNLGADGKLTFGFNTGCYISYISSASGDLGSTFGITTAGTSTTTITEPYTTTITAVTGINETPQTTTIHYNTTTGQRTLTAKMNLDTKLSELGINDNKTITVVTSGTAHGITVEKDDTINDMLIALAGLGISGSIDNDTGKLTLTPSGNAYISFINADLANALKLSNTSSEYYDSTTKTLYGTSNSNILSHTITATGNTTLNDAGILTEDGVKTITVNVDGTNETINFNKNETIDGLCAALAGAGISASFYDGMFHLNPTGTSYITHNDIASGMKVNDTTYTTSQSNTTGNMTLNDAGILTADGVKTITVNVDGTNETINFDKNETIDGLCAALAGAGISASFYDGKFHLNPTGTSYITHNDIASGMKVNDTTYATAPSAMTSDTTLGQIGVTVNVTITCVSDGTTVSATFATTDKIESVVDFLNGCGIAAYIKDGKLFTQGTGNDYITGMTGDLATKLNISTSSYTTTTAQTNCNSCSNTAYTKTATVNVTGNTTLNDAGILTEDGVKTITVNVDGTNETINFNKNETIDGLCAALAGAGISASFYDGMFHLNPTGTSYITHNDIASGMKVNNTTYTTSTATIKMTDTTELRTLGITNPSSVAVTHNGVARTLNFTQYSTIGDVRDSLAGVGIDTSIADGKLTLTPSAGSFITSLGVLSSLNLSATYTTDTTTHNADTTTSLSTLNLSANQTITVDGTCGTHSITIETTDSIDDLFTLLAGYDISGSIENGIITLTPTGSNYVKSITNDLKAKLKLTENNSGYYSTYTTTVKDNTTSDSLTYKDSAEELTLSTKLSDVGVSNGKIIINRNNSQTNTIDIDNTKTLDEFFNQIDDYGLIGSVDSDGKVSIVGLQDTWITAPAENGSDILTKLKLSAFGQNTYTASVNKTSDELTHTVTVVATGTTKLKDLINPSVNAPTSGALTITTTSANNDNSYTTTFNTTTTTLHDVFEYLADAGIEAHIDSAGRITMTSSSLTDFDIGGDLGTYLKSGASFRTKDYDVGMTYNTTTNLQETTVHYMDDNDALSKFAITNGNILITTEDGTSTVAIDNTTTIGQFRELMASYGFTSTLSGGRLSFTGIGDSYASEIADGSNILTQLGITTWTQSGRLQESGHLGDTVTTHPATTNMTQKLSELTDSSGTSLGITDGMIYVYQNGTRSAFNIDTDETLETLASRLSQYGITMGMSTDGKLYFDGNDDTYMTTQGLSSSSNILDRFGINDKTSSWSARYNSTTDNLTYDIDNTPFADDNVLMTNLKNSDGDSLGITTGSFYVYQNGIRNTESITDSTTLGDFKAMMASYGLVTDTTSASTISVNGYNGTYLATSALASPNSNVVSTLFAEWDFTNVYTTNHIEQPHNVTAAISATTRLADIITNESTGACGYTAGNIIVQQDGVQTTISLTADDTVGTFMAQLELHGFETVINDKGQLVVRGNGNSTLLNATQNASNILSIMNIESLQWDTTSSYLGELDTTDTVAITRDTLLSNIKDNGTTPITSGEYYIYNNGVRYAAMISSDETVGSFMDTLENFGIQTAINADGKITLLGSGDTYLTKSNSVNASNVIHALFGTDTPTASVQNIYEGHEQTKRVEHTLHASETTALSVYNYSTFKAEGTLDVIVNNKHNYVSIKSTDTIGDFLETMRNCGVEATINNGTIVIQAGYDTVSISATGSGHSNILKTLGLTYKDDLGGYAASSVAIQQTVITNEEKDLSAAKWANSSTQLSLLGITEGTLNIYKNGQKQTINIEENETFSSLQSKLSDITINYNDDGYISFSSASGPVQVGSTTDGSNFSAITGMSTNSDGIAISSRPLYCVNSQTKVTQEGVFRKGTVSEGTFVVGGATISITGTTTIADVISQINSNEDAQATAYWDSVLGKFVIKSRKTGASYINIEAGTSDFTDILGLTYNDSGTKGMSMRSQELGGNAKFTINGTEYQSSENEVGSDITKLTGVTLNLKEVSDEDITLTVGKDTEAAANAMSDLVDSYNELINNVDTAISSTGDLNDQTTLKLIRNQLRNLMTTSALSNLGISTASANGANIGTSNSEITTLSINKDAFIKAYSSDILGTKSSLVGIDGLGGVLGSVSSVLDTALNSSGYFDTAQSSFTKKISRLNTKINKANTSLEIYRAKLEAKFSAMDLMISKLQNQYSSFLSS